MRAFVLGRLIVGDARGGGRSVTARIRNDKSPQLDRTTRSERLALLVSGRCRAADRIGILNLFSEVVAFPSRTAERGRRRNRGMFLIGNVFLLGKLIGY